MDPLKFNTFFLITLCLTAGSLFRRGTDVIVLTFWCELLYQCNAWIRQNISLRSVSLLAKIAYSFFALVKFDDIKIQANRSPSSFFCPFPSLSYFLDCFRGL